MNTGVPSVVSIVIGMSGRYFGEKFGNFDTR